MTQLLRRIGVAFLAAALILSASVAYGQCFLSRCFNRPTTYAAQYGGYQVGTAYMPVVGSPVAAAPSVTSYRVSYMPITPGMTTVYRPTPAVYSPAVTTTSYLPVATPYATPPASPTTAYMPTTAYRPVQIVYQPRRLFRPFANMRARRAGYWPTTPVGTTWSTAYMAGYASYNVAPAVTCPTVCDPCATSSSACVSGVSMTGVSMMGASSSLGCSSCAPSATSSWQPSVDTTVPTLPSTGSSSQPTPTFKSEQGSTETRMKPQEEKSASPSASGTSLPVEERRPLVRQALYEKPIPIVEVDDPPMVEVQGWRRSP